MREPGLICPGCGLEHTVDECRHPLCPHPTAKRHLRCHGGKGGCGRHWEMTARVASIVDQMAKLEGR